MSSTVIIVSKDELTDKADFEREVQLFCEKVEHRPQSVCLFPKAGYLVPLVILLGERKISYKVEFGHK